MKEKSKLFHIPDSTESSPSHSKSEEMSSTELAAELPSKLAQLLHSVSLPELSPLSPSLPTSPAAALPPEGERGRDGGMGRERKREKGGGWERGWEGVEGWVNEKLVLCERAIGSEL